MNSSALRNRNYAIYLAGNTISLHGLWLYRVALGWFAWQLSHSELWVGIVAFTQFAPAVIFGPVFGVLADRFDRRAASILINSLSVLNMLLLGLLTAQGYIDIKVLTLLSLMQGVLDGAHAPVRMSIVPNLVPREQLHNAIALTSVAFNLSRFIGPAIAGVVIAGWGVATAFVINGISYLSLIAALLIVKLIPSGGPASVRKHPLAELVDGARYAFANDAIRHLLLLAALGSVFGRGALEMLPVFADTVYQGGASALAMLTSAIGGGAVFAGLALTRGTAWLTRKVIHTAVAVSGLLVSLLAIVDVFEIAIVVVALLGISLSFSGVGSQILIQTLVDDDVRGRVSSFWTMIAFGGTSLGALLVGTAAHVWGLQIAVFGTGVLCVAAALVARGKRKARNY